MRAAAAVMLLSGCWAAERADTRHGAPGATRPETHEERLASISITNVEDELRAGGLASYLSGPLVFLDQDAPAVHVLCGDEARKAVEDISASFADPSRVRPHCDDNGHDYRLSCGQMRFVPGQPRREYEQRTVELVVERDGAIRLESAMITLHGIFSLPYTVHDFNAAKRHAHCPP